MSESILNRVQRLLDTRQRVILGITGCPGSGKSTMAEWIIKQLDPDHVRAAWVPMDGFHLADRELDRLARRDRKGAKDTFDAHGYLALLQRLRTETSDIVYAPEFDRHIEQPVAGAIPVFPTTELIVTEGNYLLDEEDPWPRIRDEITEVWFCDVDDDIRRQRLVERHIRFGKTPEAARLWVDQVDEKNARRIQTGRARADLIVDPGNAIAPSFVTARKGI